MAPGRGIVGLFEFLEDRLATVGGNTRTGVGDLDFDLSAYLNGRDDRLAIAPPEGNLALGARGRMPWLLNL
ncbi:MAG: hypothetical protein ACOVOI_04810, partial [Hyphomicrobiales bacterium]